jgi:hypothetical protein
VRRLAACQNRCDRAPRGSRSAAGAVLAPRTARRWPRAHLELGREATSPTGQTPQRAVVARAQYVSDSWWCVAPDRRRIWRRGRPQKCSDHRSSSAGPRQSAV